MPPPMQPEQPQQAQYQQPKKNNSVLWIVLGVVVIGCCGFLSIGAAILFPVFAQARLAATKTRALSNMKILCTATMIYSTDYDDKLPADLSNYQAVDSALAQYAISQDYEPARARHTPTELLPGEHANANQSLAGTGIADSIQPQNVILYTFTSQKIPGYEIEGYLDGSARAIKKE